MLFLLPMWLFITTGRQPLFEKSCRQQDERVLRKGGGWVGWGEGGPPSAHRWQRWMWMLSLTNQPKHLAETKVGTGLSAGGTRMAASRTHSHLLGPHEKVFVKGAQKWPFSDPRPCIGGLPTITKDVCVDNAALFWVVWAVQDECSSQSGWRGYSGPHHHLSPTLERPAGKMTTSFHSWKFGQQKERKKMFLLQEDGWNLGRKKKFEE